MKKLTLIAASVIATLAGCSSTSNPEQNIVDSLADNLDIKYTIVTNQGADNGLACQDLGAEFASCNKVNMTLINQGDTIDSKDWTIYFHSIRLILEVGNDQFKVTRITGDLHKLEPTDKFDGFAAGETVEIPLVAEYWQLFETDFMPGAFVVANNAEPKLIASLNTENTSSYVTELTPQQQKRVTADNNVFATPQTRFEKNADVLALDITSALLPTPMHVELAEGKVDISQGLALPKQQFADAQFTAIETRAKLIGVDVEGKLPVAIALTPKLFTGEMAVSGAYQLDITAQGIDIKAFDQAGLFYALQSVFGLVDSSNASELPLLSIKDAPRFDYRGVMVDVARHFHTKPAILATLDQMSAYKMNKLHLHLSDDEGWRIAIPGLPELTDVGGNRCFDLDETRCLLPQLGSGPTSDNFGSGFFSKADYVEILKYAKARNIDVIPEIDMPAHARSAVVSMEARYKRLMKVGDEVGASEYRLMDPLDTSNVTTIQFYDKRSFINPCLASSTRFVDKVISEIAAMHQEADMPLTTWHFGGDETKNIKLNAGFQDINANDKLSWKGNIDLSQQDMPFAKSPQCKILLDKGVVSDFAHLPSHFAEQVSKIAASKGIPSFQAWQDGLKYSENAQSFSTENTRVNFWDTLYWGGAASAYEWSDKGYDVIISNPDYVYMDMPYEVDAKERGYYWATRATDTRKMFSFAPENLPQNAETSVDRDGNGFNGVGGVEGKAFHGLSAQLWSESVRNDEQYEYMVFPRVLAAAERSWHKADWENDYKAGVEYSLETNLVNKQALTDDWTRVANIIGQRELTKLEKAGIDYRLPLPGAKIENGILAMNIQFPGVALQYSTDGKNWLDYSAQAQPKVTGEVWIRSISTSGERASRVTSLK